MRYSTTSPQQLGTIVTRRAFLWRLVVMGTAIPVMGSVLAACGGDDDADDGPAADSDAAPIATAASATVTETPDREPPPTATEAAAVEPTSTQTEPTAEPTAEPGGATTAPASPTSEFPAVGALRLSDGAVAWSVSSPEEVYRREVGASEDIVLIQESVSFERARVLTWRTIAYDAANGSERWRRLTADTLTPPGPVDGQGIVVLADQDAGALVGVDVLTGEERWRVASRDVPLANSPTVAVVWNLAAYEADPGTPSGFRGMDRLTGDELWASDTLLPYPTWLSDQTGYAGLRSPAMVLGEILAVPTGATVTAIDVQTGAILWQAPQLGHLGAADGVIVGTRGPVQPGNWITFTALDAASGQERWTAPGRPPSPRSFLAAGDGVIIIFAPPDYPSDSLVLIAYELSSGTERWRVTRIGDPQLISGTSLVMRLDNELAVLSTTDGATLWAAIEPFGSPRMDSVASNGDAVFVAINSLPYSD
jgi:outer membrane protein assembly factor BamB